MGLLTTVLDKELTGKFEFKKIRPEDYFLWCDLIIKRKLYSKSIESFQAYYRISSRQRSKNKFNAFLRLYNFYAKYLNEGFFRAIYFIAQWTGENLKQRFSPKYQFKIEEHPEIFR